MDRDTSKSCRARSEMGRKMSSSGDAGCTQPRTRRRPGAGLRCMQRTIQLIRRQGGRSSTPRPGAARLPATRRAFPSATGSTPSGALFKQPYSMHTRLPESRLCTSLGRLQIHAQVFSIPGLMSAHHLKVPVLAYGCFVHIICPSAPCDELRSIACGGHLLLQLKPYA